MISPYSVNDDHDSANRVKENKKGTCRDDGRYSDNVANHARDSENGKMSVFFPANDSYEGDWGDGVS